MLSVIHDTGKVVDVVERNDGARNRGIRFAALYLSAPNQIKVKSAVVGDLFKGKVALISVKQAKLVGVDISVKNSVSTCEFADMGYAVAVDFENIIVSAGIGRAVGNHKVVNRCAVKATDRVADSALTAGLIDLVVKRIEYG